MFLVLDCFFCCLIKIMLSGITLDRSSIMVGNFFIEDFCCLIRTYWHNLDCLLMLSIKCHDVQVWLPTNPQGAERLPPGIVVSETDFYQRRLWGLPEEVCCPSNNKPD